MQVKASRFMACCLEALVEVCSLCRLQVVRASFRAYAWLEYLRQAGLKGCVISCYVVMPPFFLYWYIFISFSKPQACKPLLSLFSLSLSEKAFVYCLLYYSEKVIGWEMM